MTIAARLILPEGGRPLPVDEEGLEGPISQGTTVKQDCSEMAFSFDQPSRSPSPRSPLDYSASGDAPGDKRVLERSMSFAAWGNSEANGFQGAAAVLLEDASETFLNDRRPGGLGESMWGDCTDEFVESGDKGRTESAKGNMFSNWSKRSVDLGTEARNMQSCSTVRPPGGEIAFGSWDLQSDALASGNRREARTAVDLLCREEELLCDEDGGGATHTRSSSIGVKRSESDTAVGIEELSAFETAPKVNTRTPENSPKKRTKPHELGMSLDYWLPFKETIPLVAAQGLGLETAGISGLALAGSDTSSQEEAQVMDEGSEGVAFTGDRRMVDIEGAKAGENTSESSPVRTSIAAPTTEQEQGLNDSPSRGGHVTPLIIPPSPSSKRAAPSARAGGPMSPGTKNKWANGLKKAQGMLGKEGLYEPRKPPRARRWALKDGPKTEEGIVRERRGFGALRLNENEWATTDRELEIRSRIRRLTPEEKAARMQAAYPLFSAVGKRGEEVDASQSDTPNADPSSSSTGSFKIHTNARLMRINSDAHSNFQANGIVPAGGWPPMPEASQVESEGSKHSYSGAVVGAFGNGEALDSPETPQVPAVKDVGQECPEGPNGRHKMTRQGSLMETKLLMTTALKRTQSFFLFNKHFEFIKVIGRGSFSTVYQARDRKRGGLCAIKKSKREFQGRDDRDRYLHEIQSVACLSEHPHVVKYYRGWQQEGHFLIQMELCEGGNLKDWIEKQTNPLEEEQIWSWVRQIAAGLHHLHTKSVLHLDIKPENIFLDAQGLLKIGDFGLAVLKRQWEWEEGDGAYVAPELLREHEPGPEADMYSFGAMIFEWASGRQLARLGPEREGVIELPIDRSGSLCRLVRSLLSRQPNQRPSAEDVLAWEH